MIIERYFENPEVLHVGTCENRAYFVPTSIGAKSSSMHTSDRVTMLSGDDWKFRFYNNPYEVTDFFTNGFCCDDFDTIEVPSCWQMLGYDKHQYANVQYPFPFDPPYVPTENPCGAYIRRFFIHDNTAHMKQYLNFEGVDSCFYVWVNGLFVGYSQVSHSTSEFDISDFVKSGENTLAVLVLKWCDGSYLEDQDKLRMSGIFRDVYIMARPKNHIRDYYVKTMTDTSYKHAQVSIDFSWIGKSGDIQVSLYDPEGNISETKHTQSNQIVFDIQNALLWNAETPHLYELVIQTEDEEIRQDIGIRSFEVKGKLFCVNGVNIKFKGVNRHDSDPFTGYTICEDQLLQDLALMKQHNFNAIRSSHYPNAPWATQMYARFGFYVIAESDIETHGTVTIYNGGAEEWGYEKEFREDRTYGMLCHDTRFEQAFLDRVQRNVERDKNNAAVVLWSLGNESGYGPNPEKAAAWIKSFDKHMLVHYESSIHQMKGYKNNISNIDVFSHMYAPTEAIDTIVKTFLNKPFIQCEFVHAMGNGPGDIEDYFEQIYAYDEFAGGFVWEWCDHAVWMGTTVEGKDKFYYGGDFGEFPHDGNFCIDGLVYPDRRIHTGLLEWKNCARPMRVYDVDISKGIVRIANKTDFTNLKDMLNVHFEVSQDGNIIETGIIDDLDILPHTEKEIRLNFTVPHEGNSYIRIISTQKYDSDFIKAGYELGFDQLCICKAEKKPHILTNPLPVTIAESETEFLLSSKDFRYSFNRLTGMFDTLVKDNVSLLCAPMECNIWRAPTDNDRVIRQDWENAGYDRKTIKVYESDIAQNDSCVIIRVRMAISAVFIQRIANIEAVWTIHNDGSIQVHMDVARNTDLPYLPRFGLRMMLAKTFNTVQYEGYGPNESYIDKHRSSYYGKFTSKVCDMHEDYIKPQENSSRWGCSEVCLFDKNYAVKICSDRFSFNVSEYTQEELACKKHNFELEKSNATVLCLDSAMSGIGSGSCGPQLKPCYQVNDAHFTLDFMLQFFSAENY